MKYALLTPLQTPVTKTITIPGSKSFTNRALILAGLTKGKVIIKNALISDDTLALISCLEKLGIEIVRNKNTITVSGDISQIKNKKYILDARLSGTAIRFLTALSCITAGEKIISGEEGLLKRPITDLVRGLQQLGAKIEYIEKEGFPPLSVLSRPLREGKGEGRVITLSGNISSQFLSAILMIAPSIGDITIKLSSNVISKPYVEMTIEMMKQFGVEVINENFERFVVKKQQYKAKKITIEGDYSSASYFAAVAVLTKSTVTLKNLNPNSVQADAEFFEILEKMGNKITKEKNAITIIGKKVKPITIDMINCPDQIQTLSVLAAFVHGKTQISGISSLRVKETDRLVAIQTELNKMGIKTEITGNILTIFGKNPYAATIDTYKDHRMAMSFSVAGSVLSGIRIKNPAVVNKTFPDFFNELKKLGIGVSIKETGNKKIVVTGFMGAGKSSISPLLAKKLKFNVIEMDEQVLHISKNKSIKDVFEKFGEKKFREMETKVAVSLLHKKNIVISAGGGVIMNQKTMQELTKNATVVFLETKFETILKRLVNTSDRPLWKNKIETKKLFQLREPLYKQYADVIVETDGKSLGMVTDEIVQQLKSL